MKTVAVAALAATFLIATPAVAQSYDAYSSFTGVTPQDAASAGGFVYGQRQPGVGGVRFTSNQNCVISGSICLQQSSTGGVDSLPGVYKGGSPALQYDTAIVPANSLLVHPGSDPGLVTYLGFLVPTTHAYNIFGSFAVSDTNPTGVDIFFTYAPGNAVTSNQTALGSIGSNRASLTDFRTLTLNAGDSISYAIANGGSYFNDSTAVAFRITAVPEPATWALMMMGFGAVGFAMRRRTRATVSYA